MGHGQCLNQGLDTTALTAARRTSNYYSCRRKKVLISLWAFSEDPALLVVEPREVVLWDMDSASTRVWIQLLLPLPGGPATITPVGERKF